MNNKKKDRERFTFPHDATRKETGKMIILLGIGVTVEVYKMANNSCLTLFNRFLHRFHTVER